MEPRKLVLTLLVLRWCYVYLFPTRWHRQLLRVGLKAEKTVWQCLSHLCSQIGWPGRHWMWQGLRILLTPNPIWPAPHWTQLTSAGSADQSAVAETIIGVRGKFARSSRMEMAEVLWPSQADSRGVAFSGAIMEWVDICAGLAAKMHAELPCVTASVDAIHFLRPIYVGEVVLLKASVNRSWRTSMEVGVRVEAENLTTGTRRYCCHAFLTFVALKQGRPTAVPLVVPETALEKAWHADAESRRQIRMARKMFGCPSTSYQQDSNATRSLPPNASPMADQLYIPMAAFQYHHSSPTLRVEEAVTEKQDEIRSSLQSYTQNVQLVMPQHANTLHVTFGGHIIRLMEHCAYVSAARHAHSVSGPWRLFRTASIDSLNFLHPTRVGDIITVRSYVSRAWKTSLEVYITVHTHSQTYSEWDGDEGDDEGNALLPDASSVSWKLTNDGYMTFVAVRDDEKEYGRLPGRHEDASTPSARAEPDPLPRVKPLTVEEQQRYLTANERRKSRLKERHELEGRLRNLEAIHTPV